LNIFIPVGIAMMIVETLVAQYWSSAIIAFLVVLVLSVNLVTYNVSGVWLIRVLRKHQETGTATAGEDISGSKSASPFDVVIKKTVRSMILLTVPTLAAVLVFVVIGVGATNTTVRVAYDPNNVPWSFNVVLFIQLVLGFLFTRIGWVSKAALEAAIVGKAGSTPSTGSRAGSEGSPEKKSGRSSKAEKDKALRMSQKPRFSENTTPAHSRPEADLQEASPAVEITAVQEASPAAAATSEELGQVVDVVVV